MTTKQLEHLAKLLRDAYTAIGQIVVQPHGVQPRRVASSRVYCAILMVEAELADQLPTPVPLHQPLPRRARTLGHIRKRQNPGASKTPLAPAPSAPVDSGDLPGPKNPR